MTIPSGTSLDVTLGTALSSESARIGDAWTGSVLNGRDGIPAGSVIRGTVRAVTAAQKGNRASRLKRAASDPITCTRAWSRR